MRAAVAAGAGSGDGHAALLLGDAERTAARRGGAGSRSGSISNVFGLCLVVVCMARGKKKPRRRGYTSMRVMASQVVLLVVRHAKFVRFITGRHMIEIKRRVVMFRRRIIVTLVLPHRRGGLLRIAEAGCQDRRTIAAQRIVSWISIRLLLMQGD